ncbi:MAG: hypothetical protein CMP10_20945 [Zetaproteobacteria bacterium]|nr:hypothetical protein [Pseudobdellovibrionaceae bacterium]
MVLNSKNQSGMSVIEALISVGIVSIAAVTMFKGQSIFLSQKRISKDIPAVTKLGSQLVRYGRKSVESAICSMVHSGPMTGPGVGKVFLKLPPKQSSFKLLKGGKSPDALLGWRPQKRKPKLGCETIDTYNSCYRMTPKNQVKVKNSGKRMIIGTVSISPIYVNPNLGMWSLVPLDKDSQVSNVGFQIDTSISYNKNSEERVTRHLSDFVWAASLGVCPPGNNWFSKPYGQYLSLSGTSSNASGIGQTLYNIPDYSVSNESMTRIEWVKSQIQQGQFVDGRQGVTSDLSTNVAVSCNERRYSCPNLQKPRNYNEMDLSARIEYIHNNTVAPFASPVRYKPRLEVRQGFAGRDLLRGDNTHSLKMNDDSAYTSVEDVDDNLKKYYLRNGVHPIQFKVEAAQATTMCRKICSTPNYNSISKTQNVFKAYLRGYMPEYGHTEPRSSAPVYCTACYMKNCANIGLGTFGPMFEQPYQPVDSGTPECWVNEQKPSQNWYNKGSFRLSGNTNTFSGIMGSLSGNKMVFEDGDKDNELPVLCYNWGKFRLARKLQGSNWALRRGSFNQANKICFDMAEENINVQDLAGALPQGSPVPPAQYKNLANQGLFIGPQYSDDVRNLKQWMESKQISLSTKFWVAFVGYSEPGAENQILAQPPFISKAVTDEKFAIYHNDRGFLAAGIIEQKLRFEDSPDKYDGALLLYHGLKYKGVVRASESQEKYPFLCKNKQGKLYISEEKSKNPGYGSAICKGNFENAMLTTPRQWLDALYLVNKNQDNMPFPDKSVGEPVWVNSYIGAQQIVDKKEKSSSEDGSSSAEDGASPAEDGSSPAEDGSSPAEDGSSPAEGGGGG